MLGTYVNALNHMIESDRAGEEVTRYSLAKRLNISRYKTTKILRDLQDFDMVFEVKKLHRKPSLYKSVYQISTRGSAWAFMMDQKRMFV